MSKVVLFVCFVLLKEVLCSLGYTLNGSERDWSPMVRLGARPVALRLDEKGFEGDD